MPHSMLPLPPSCRGCVLEHKGLGFCPDETRPGSTVAILGLQPSKDDVMGRMIMGYDGPGRPLYESCVPRPMIGSAGWMLCNTYLPLSGLKRDDVSIHHLLKCHTKELPKGKEYEEALKHCTQAHLSFSQGCNVIVAQGQEVWDFTQGKGFNIHDWRGFIGPRNIRVDERPNRSIPVYGTLATSDLFKDPHARFISRFDYKRLARLVRREWPSDIPHQCIARPDNRTTFIQLLEEALCQPEVVCDTEYIPSSKLMTHVGLAWKSLPSTSSQGKDPSANSTSLVIKGVQLEWVRGSATSAERSIFMKYWRRLCDSTTMGFWNAKADLPILEHNLGCIPRRFEDPMQAHAVLWPDMPHDYEFVASIYGRYNKLKHLSKDNILLYHWGDLIDLVWIWEDLKKELKNDPGCERKYREQNLKLIPILLEREAKGIRTNQCRIEEAIPQYEQITQDAQTLAQAYCGFPVNLGSTKQLMDYLGLSESVQLRGMDKDCVAIARSKYLPFDADQEEKEGFSVEYVCERVAQGAHPLLELRTMYAQNSHTLSSYLRPLRGVERVYPQINIHTQAGGRHSTTNPPLATLPDDLRDLVIPDPGTAWIGWDWDAQEPRIQAAESGSKVLQRAFEEGEDIHTSLVCLLYGWEFPQDRRNPHSSAIDAGWRQAHSWGGKEDVRRVFAKTLRYEMNYGGKGNKAAAKAIRMGVDEKVVKKAAQVLLQSDPELRQWFDTVEKNARATKVVRSWGGGRRVFYWQDGLSKSTDNEARNFPPQGGGADLYNLTIVEITRRLPGVTFVYGMHDSLWFQCDQNRSREFYPLIKEIATQPRLINGTMVPFPASFKLMDDQGVVTKL